MSGVREIIGSLMSESVTMVNGHKYECYFGRYYRDGKPITPEEYEKETHNVDSHGYDPSEDGEHYIVTRNGKSYHLDPGETLDDEDDEPQEVPETPKNYFARSGAKSCSAAKLYGKLGPDEELYGYIITNGSGTSARGSSGMFGDIQKATVFRDKESARDTTKIIRMSGAQIKKVKVNNKRIRVL